MMSQRSSFENGVLKMEGVCLSFFPPNTLASLRIPELDVTIVRSREELIAGVVEVHALELEGD